MQHRLGVIAPCLIAMMVSSQSARPHASPLTLDSRRLARPDVNVARQQQQRHVFGFRTGAASPKRTGAREKGPALLPANLRVPDGVLPLVRTMWLRSPTFRRQCARLVENPAVTVTIAFSSPRANVHARTHIARDGAGIFATVEIGSSSPDVFVEHIAHELEHILEEIDGVDHLRLVRQGVDGILISEGDYETARARAIGRKVAREVMFR
jgi:hypothetical protein